MDHDALQFNTTTADEVHILLTQLRVIQRAFISHLIGKNVNIFYDTLKDAVHQRLDADDEQLHAIES